jgi:hypothetical protein
MPPKTNSATESSQIHHTEAPPQEEIKRAAESNRLQPPAASLYPSKN